MYSFLSCPQANVWRRTVVRTITAASLIGQGYWLPPAQAAAYLPYCQQTLEGIGQKNSARQVSLKGDKGADRQYQAIIKTHADQLRQCRRQNWLKEQAIWIRLYPCDTQPGRLEEILDRIVDRGYNQVYVETFFNGQVLLPAADNPTPWSPVLNDPDQAKVDLLAQVIRKGRERGLAVYSWLFSMNFGYGYGIRPDRQATLARNGRGQTSLTLSNDENRPPGADEVFIDPYSPQARQDYAAMVRAVAKRRPDGILFDYIRYPRQSGAASLATKVQDLWIYSDSAQKALLLRAQNEKGRELIRRYLAQGSLAVADVEEVDKLFPEEPNPPLWQGRTPVANENQYPVADRRDVLQVELWRLSVGHAMQGVVDFLAANAAIAQQSGITAGAVFFPEGNQMVRRGFDSRLQPWDRFPTSLEWHPMSYAVCGNPDCITAQVQRVISQAPRGVQIKPVLAGIWQQSYNNHPPLEAQMQGVRRVLPNAASVSHFAYSWQEPLSDQDRKACRNPRP
jgi:Glycosyl hydrolase-like 10